MLIKKGARSIRDFLRAPTLDQNHLSAEQIVLYFEIDSWTIYDRGKMIMQVVKVNMKKIRNFLSIFFI